MGVGADLVDCLARRGSKGSDALTCDAARALTSMRMPQNTRSVKPADRPGWLRATWNAARRGRGGSAPSSGSRQGGPPRAPRSRRGTGARWVLHTSNPGFEIEIGAIPGKSRYVAGVDQLRARRFLISHARAGTRLLSEMEPEAFNRPKLRVEVPHTRDGEGPAGRGDGEPLARRRDATQPSRGRGGSAPSSGSRRGGPPASHPGRRRRRFRRGPSGRPG